MKLIIKVFTITALVLSLVACGTKTPTAEISNLRVTGIFVRFDLTMRDRDRIVEKIEVQLVRENGEVIYTIDEANDHLRSHGFFSESFTVSHLRAGTYYVIVVATYTLGGETLVDEELDRKSFELPG